MPLECLVLFRHAHALDISYMPIGEETSWRISEKGGDAVHEQLLELIEDPTRVRQSRYVAHSIVVEGLLLARLPE